MNSPNDRKLNILCLAPEDSSLMMLPSYASAFRRRDVGFHFLDWSVPLDTSLDAILASLSFTPDYFFLPDSGFPLLPLGLAQSAIPTIRLDVDTYTFTHRRLRWATLFDHVAVCHPNYDVLFRERIAHSGTLMLPHAADRDFYERPEIPREFEVGWVGQSSGPIYHKRATWLPKLQSEFRTNDWSIRCSLKDVADVYRRSKIVVNIARDDYPQDANIRVFEVLASGALLITALPGELTALGFVPNEHFVPYRDESELPALVRRYLDDENSRSRIAQAGRKLALSEHTHDNRVDALLRYLEHSGQNKFAPARQWPASRVGLMYLDYFSGHAVYPCAKAQFWKIAGRNLRDTLDGATLFARALWKHLRSRSK